MRQLLLATAIALLSQSLFASVNWPNEPPGSTQLLDCGFDNTTCGGKLLDGYKTSGRTLNVVQDQTAPLSPANVVRSTRFANVASGGTQLEYYLPNGTKEIYAAFWWRTSNPFTGKNHGANKTFFIRGQSPGTNGYFCFELPPGTSTGSLSWRTQLPNNLDQCGGLDQDVCRANINNVPIKIGEWYRIEVYMKASTCATCHDGIARWWINGTLAGNYSNFAYGPAVDVWLWAETWDGSGPANEWVTEAYHQLDHLHISAPNCGAAGCAAPPYLIITSSLPTARTGTPFLANLTADGGTKPYTWFLESGNLPAGLTLNKGVISGTPTCVGRSNFTVRVTDASAPALSVTKSYSIITSGTSTSCPTISITGSRTETEKSRFTAKAVGGKVTFSLPATASGHYRLSIYDLAGKKVYEHSSMAQKEISISKTLKSGVYLAKFVQGTQSSAFRFHVLN